MPEPQADVVPKLSERLAAIESIPLPERATAYQDVYVELSTRLEAIDGRTVEQ